MQRDQIQADRERNRLQQDQSEAEWERNKLQQDQIQAQRDLIVALGAEVPSLKEHNAKLIDRLSSLEAERAQLARLPAELARIQAEMRVPQGQEPLATVPRYVALEL